jgi:hypothetical protein
MSVDNVTSEKVVRKRRQRDELNLAPEIDPVEIKRFDIFLEEQKKEVERKELEAKKRREENDLLEEIELGKEPILEVSPSRIKKVVLSTLFLFYIVFKVYVSVI